MRSAALLLACVLAAPVAAARQSGQDAALKALADEFMRSKEVHQ